MCIRDRDKSIEAYKQGVELTRALHRQLEGARQQLKVLSEDEDADSQEAEK